MDIINFVNLLRRISVKRQAGGMFSRVEPVIQPRTMERFALEATQDIGALVSTDYGER